MGPAAVRYAMKPVGEPDAGNRHVRFDERGWETERLAQPQATALILDSTRSIRATGLTSAIYLDAVSTPNTSFKNRGVATLYSRSARSSAAFCGLVKACWVPLKT